jgi:hypothetical protein
MKQVPTTSTSPQAHIPWGHIKVLGFLVLTVIACLLIGQATAFLFPSIRGKESDVRRLGQSFSILEQLKVQDYLNGDSCNRIHYSRGWFAEPLDCAPYDRDTDRDVPAMPFDDQATGDFRSVEGELRDTGVPIRKLDANYGANGDLRTATFWLRCTCYWRYTYQPNYTSMQPGEVPGEIWHTRINKDWYLTDEDWN